MSMPQKHPLRALTEQEERELRRIEKAGSERVDVVRRAKALLVVAEHQTFPQAAATAGFKEARSVSHLVERFNRQGLAALLIASGRGRKPTYTSEQRARILEEVQREPDREKDQTATWSLLLLRNALRKGDLPQIARETIRQVLARRPAIAISEPARGAVPATLCGFAKAGPLRPMTPRHWKKKTD